MVRGNDPPRRTFERGNEVGKSGARWSRGTWGRESREREEEEMVSQGHEVRESERTSAGDMVASRTGSCLIRSTELGRDFLMEVTFN